MGGTLQPLVQKLQEIEREVEEVERTVARQCPRNMELKPGQVRDAVVKTMMNLRSAILEGDVTLAKNALMKHVGRVVLTPTAIEMEKTL